MSAPTQSSVNAYQTILYDRVLHPEWFQLCARHSTSEPNYEMELWLTPGGHVVRFEHAGHRLCELVTDQDDNLPRTGVLQVIDCAGDHDFELDLEEFALKYMTNIQTETLSEHIYMETLQDMREHVRRHASLCHEWSTAQGPCLSVVDIHTNKMEIHVDCYHLVATQGFVLRTQSIFEHT